MTSNSAVGGGRKGMKRGGEGEGVLLGKASDM